VRGDTVHEERDGRPAVSRSETVALSILVLFTLCAVLGYAVYGLHPERLPSSELALSVFSASFTAFARLHIVLAGAVLSYVLVRRTGLRWLLPLVVVSSLSFGAEHVGTGYGVPFGGYAYSGLLGPKLGGRVPFLIPLSWFLMALPAWILAGDGGRFRRVALGAAWLVVWDLALDPAMSFLTPYWMWENSGAYYGMPWVNLAGWYGTGVVLMAALEALSGWASFDRLDRRWMAAYYATILAMPLGMLVGAGLWGAVAATALGVGSCAAASGARLSSTARSARTPMVSEPVEA